MICYFKRVSTQLNRLGSFASAIDCYQDDPIVHFAPFAKVDAREHEQDYLISQQFPLVALKTQPVDEARLPFPEYKTVLEQVFCFLKEFLYLFESTQLANLAKEVYHFLRVVNGDVGHFESCRTLLRGSSICIHPCLLLYHAKFMHVRSRIFKYMRTSIQYSYQKDLLYSPNNVLHFVLHWNQMFLPNTFSGLPESTDMDIFKSKA